MDAPGMGSAGRSDLESALARALRQRAVSNLLELIQAVSADADSVRQVLADVVHRGQVAELRPVTAHAGSGDIFYRWRRQGDGAYRAQQDLFEGARRRAGSRWYDGKRIKETDHADA